MSARDSSHIVVRITRCSLAAALFLFTGARTGLAMADLFTGTAGNLTSRGWTAYSGAGSGPVTLSSNTAHLSSANAEDVARTFGGFSPARETDRFLYYRFRVTVTALPTSGQAGDYFLALRDSVQANTRGHVWIKYNTPTSAQIGVSYLATDPPQYPADPVPLNTEVEFVVKLDRGNGTAKPSATITLYDPNSSVYTATSTTAVDETFTPDTIALCQSNNTGGMGDLLVDEVITGVAPGEVHGAIFDATTYGATASSTTINDDQPGIQGAINACVANGGGIVVIPPGRYDVTGDNWTTTGFEPKNAFFINNAHDVTVQGNGAAIMMRNGTTDPQASTIPLWGQALAIQGLNESTYTTNTTIKSLSIDWKRPPFTVATVTNVAFGTPGHDWTITAVSDPVAFPMPGDIGLNNATWNVESVIDFEPTLGTPISNFSFYDQSSGTDVIKSTYLASTNTWTLTLHSSSTNTYGVAHLTKALNDLSTASPARKIVMRHRTSTGTARPDIYGHDCINVFRASNTKFDDVIVNATCGKTIHATACTDLTFNRVKIQSSSSARLISSLVDGIFVTFCKGAVKLDSCLFRNTGDDSFNVNSKYMQVLSKTASGASDTIVTVAPGVRPFNADGTPGTSNGGDKGPTPLAGDAYEFVTELAHDPIDPGTVHTITSAVYNSNTDGYSRPGWNLKFPNASVASLPINSYIVSTAYNPSVSVTGTMFDGSEARGMIVSARNVTVDHCTFRNQAFNGLLFYSDPEGSGAQGPGAQNVSITNNKFEACGAAPIGLLAKGGATKMHADLVPPVNGNSNRPASAGMFRNFYIFNNDIWRDRSGITPKVNDLRLQRSANNGSGDQQLPYYLAGIDLRALDVINSTDVNVIATNTFHGTGPVAGFQPVVYLNHVSNHSTTVPAAQINFTDLLATGMQWEKAADNTASGHPYLTPAPYVTGAAGYLQQADKLPELTDGDGETSSTQYGDVRQ